MFGQMLGWRPTFVYVIRIWEIRDLPQWAITLILRHSWSRNHEQEQQYKI